MAEDTASAEVTQLNNQTIYIESDGSHYSGYQSGAAITGKIRIELDTGVSGRVQKWSAWPKLLSRTEPGGAEAWFSEDFQSSGRAKSYESPRPKEVDEEFSFTITPPQYTAFLVAACNNYADQLRGEGQSSAQIFEKDRWIQVGVASGLYHEMSGPSGNPLPGEVVGWGYFKKINVICKASESLDPVEQPITASYIRVEAVQTSAVRGKCELKLAGSVISKNPNTEVTFRYVDDKGQQSDLKTASTGADRTVAFKHDYPLSADKKSGKIRIVGQSHAFFSNWDSFENDCSTPPQDVATLLPPKAFHLEAIAKADTVMHRGLVCPANVAIWGIIKGRGPMTGAVTLRAGGSIKKLQVYNIENDEQVIVQGEHELSWSPQSLGQQNVKYTMDVTNKQGDIVDHMDVTQNFVCVKPQVSDAAQGAPGGLAGDVETPKSTNLAVNELGKKAQNGYVCPVKGRALAHIQTGAKSFSGKIEIYAGGSVKQQFDIDLPANYTTFYPYDHELAWDGTTIPSQNIVFAMKVLNQHGFEVASHNAVKKFDCTEIVTTGVAMPGGGYAPAPKDPTTSQQNRPAAAGQLAIGPALAIMAPKGTVRSGQIRLTGGPANATYELTFYRKVSGGYQPVNSAQLPKQMTGLTASFDLAGLDGGQQWRLEVCPVMGGQGTCKTSDFRVPRIGAKQQQAPAQATPFVIVPGAIQQ